MTAPQDGGCRARIRVLALQRTVSIDEIPDGITVDQIKAERRLIQEEIRYRYTAGRDPT